MNAFSYTQVRSNFAQTMDQVCNNHSPIIITRQNQPPVVMISLEDYIAIEETLYLLKSPKNAARLTKAISEVEQGMIEKKDIFE